MLKSAFLSGLIVTAALVLMSIMSNVFGSAGFNKTEAAARKFAEESSKLISLASQDSNPVISLVHATEALVWAKALNSITSESNIKKLYGVHAYNLEQDASTAQQDSIRRLTEST